MAIDGISLRAVTDELQILKNSRIERIQQPDKYLVILHLSVPNNGRIKLMLNIHNENGRIQLTRDGFESPETPSSFCMVLRKYLSGARLIDIQQMGLDRIAVFTVLGRTDLYDDLHLKLIVELMGKHGNIFLVNADSGLILDCIRHFGPGDDSVRICLPNCTYAQPPSQNKVDPFAVSMDTVKVIAENRSPDQWLAQCFTGVSRLFAQQLIRSDTPPHLIAETCYSALQELASGHYSPSVLDEKGVLPFIPANAEHVRTSTMSEAYDCFYRSKDEKAALKHRQAGLRGIIEHNLKKALKKMERFQMEISDSESIEKNRRMGELLMMNLRTASSSKEEATVMDYYSDPPVAVSIPINPAFSLAKNAQLYFKKYHKAKNASLYALSQLDSLQEEIRYLESLQISLDCCTTSEDIRELKEELIEQGYIKSESKHIRKKQPVTLPYVYRAPDGTMIRAGKNNKQNDFLFRTQPPASIWLHVKNAAGSHVYIDNNQPSKETLGIAAEIAAFHSRLCKSANVPVDYTEHRMVKKPSGSRPGFVNYFNQHTVYVTPDPEKLLQMRCTEEE